MPRPPSKAAKASLYRLTLKSDQDLELGIQKKYLEGENRFSTETVNIAGIDGLFVYGEIPNDEPAWTKHAVSVTSFHFSVRNQTSAGLLLLRIDKSDDHAYCISWSMGHLLINSTHIDDGFGLRFALRKADPDDVRSLTSHSIDTVPRTARTSVIGGAPLGSFGLEEIGEIVSRFVGQVSSEGLSCYVKPSSIKVGDKTIAGSPKKITVRGADSLGIPLAKSPSELITDLKLIDSIVEKSAPREELKHLENTQPLRPGNPKIELLEQQLANDLCIGGSGLALSWPAEFDEEPGEVSKYRMSNTGAGRPREFDELELDCFLEILDEVEPDLRLRRLRSIKVQARAEGGTPMTREIPGDRWLTYQLDFGEQRYVLHRGRWYNVGGAYLDMLKAKVERIFSNKSSVSLRAWPKQVKQKKSDGAEYIGWANERVYNDHVMGSVSGFVSLDRKLVYTAQHPGGFEACDLLSPEGYLVHVKRLDDSVAASHLFNQAMNSAEALRRQPDALEKFRAKVESVSGGRRKLPADYRPSVVVIAFAGKGASPGDLFTFSQVSLSRCADRIDSLGGMELQIAFIEESDEIVTDAPLVDESN
ncbi:DUF6119 family protein [Amycolatopsis thermoflava]|uniref:DUF6119 family protein n=1 Tax=Amycolatopsis thermoflava TaxID=84480 RepID=UPI003F4A07AA